VNIGKVLTDGNSSSLTTPPNQSFHTPSYSSGYSLDYAGNTPADVVRTGVSTTAIQISTSSDFGASWNQYYGGNLYTYPGAVAYSADATTILLSSTENGTLVSRYTATFSAVPTLPSGAAIASDKRNASVFYGGSAGR
jgi:xyloglucan-specific exo-beta-1,4-glucanase